MNKTNNVIEKINVSQHNKVFSGECQKADENLQGLIVSLSFRLVSRFYSVCHCCLHSFSLSVSTQWQLNVLQRRTSSVSVCMNVHSWFQYLIVWYL